MARKLLLGTIGTVLCIALIFVPMFFNVSISAINANEDIRRNFVRCAAIAATYLLFSILMQLFIHKNRECSDRLLFCITITVNMVIMTTMTNYGLMAASYWVLLHDPTVDPMSLLIRCCGGMLILDASLVTGIFTLPNEKTSEPA